ncbi:hypothetical protein [Labrys monachus]|uniref:Type II secretion system protein GspE N-terminal domain-containing protein n=1 Tax=Labrys monachus TaxID=217067 RepID=A0ABU0F7V6_9HYPH|nr:hypothetical protein [Labrys monachus]MDQ0390694.1 hypothetical protein [Labrys monachus]
MTHREPLSDRAEMSPIDRLVEFWLKRGALREDSLERGRGTAQASGERLDRALNKLGLISDADFAEGWAAILGWPVADTYPETPLALPNVPSRFLVGAGLVPLRCDDTTLTLAVGDPLDTFSLAALSAKTGLALVPQAECHGDSPTARLISVALHRSSIRNGHPDLQPPCSVEQNTYKS